MYNHRILPRLCIKRETSHSKVGSNYRTNALEINFEMTNDVKQVFTAVAVVRLGK